MNLVREIQFNNNETADISSLVEVALDLYNYSSELKIRYSFIVEETLLKWQELYEPESIVTFRRFDGKNNFRLVLSIPGDKNNPIAENTSEDALESLVPRMKSGIGEEIKYKYKKGVNMIILTLPKRNIEESLFYTNLLHISYPIIIQNRLLTLSSIADTLMLSFYNQSSMTAASLIASLTLIFEAFMTEMMAGMSEKFVDYWNDRKFKKVSNLFALVLKLSGLIGLIFCFLGLFFAKQVLTLYTNVPEIRELGTIYLRYFSLYYLTTAISNVFICYMQNTGAVVKSSLYIIISQIINCLLNAILIFGLFNIPALGVMGAAVGSVISSVILLILSFGYYIRKNLIRLKISDFIEKNTQILKSFSDVTIPLLIRQILWFIGLNILSMILGHTNSMVLAANAIASTCLSLFDCFYDGTSEACQFLMIGTLSLKRIDKAKENGKYIMRYSFITAIIKSITFAVLIPFIPLIFKVADETTKSYLFMILGISVVRYFCAFLNSSANHGILLVSGDTKVVTIIEFLALWGLVILPAAILTFIVKVPAAVTVVFVCLDEVSIFPFIMWRERTGKWLEYAGLKKG